MLNTLIGIPVGFYAYLFPGNINLLVMELFRARKYLFLVFTLLLLLLFESVYCLVVLHFLKQLQAMPEQSSWIQLLAFALLAIMGIWMLLEKRNYNTVLHRNTVFRGIFSIIIHPQQIPFWLVMGVYLSAFIPAFGNDSNLFFFLLFNAIGTLLVMWFYMKIGNKLVFKFNLNSERLNKLLGLFYVCVALISFYLEFKQLNII